LFESGELKREDIIIQTKIGPRATAAEYQSALETSFTRLQVAEAFGGYIDLFAFHGINREDHVDLVVDTLFPVVEAWQARSWASTRQHDLLLNNTSLVRLQAKFGILVSPLMQCLEQSLGPSTLGNFPT
jgi:hypothetical protein